MSEHEQKKIPDAAVEASARILFEHTNCGSPWALVGTSFRVAYLEAARAALEAAAAPMALEAKADAWEEGHDAAADGMVKYENPYRTAK